MEGTPVSVSAARRTMFTSRLPRFAYSTSHIAAKIPKGAASVRAQAIINIVLTNAGISEAFVVLNSHSNKESFIWGMPFMIIYPTKNIIMNIVMNPAHQTASFNKNDSGLSFISLKGFTRWPSF
jgi:hypothetical protein